VSLPEGGYECATRCQLHQSLPTNSHGFADIGSPPVPPIVFRLSSSSNFAQYTDSRTFWHLLTAGYWACCHPFSPSWRSSLKRRRCGLPSWPPHGTWHTGNGHQSCPAYSRDDVDRSCDLVHQSTLGRCARERRTWQHPDRRQLALDVTRVGWIVDG
jgi:hypothetical protein